MNEITGGESMMMCKALAQGPEQFAHLVGAQQLCGIGWHWARRQKFQIGLLFVALQQSLDVSVA